MKTSGDPNAIPLPGGKYLPCLFILCGILFSLYSLVARDAAAYVALGAGQISLGLIYLRTGKAPSKDNTRDC